MKMAFPLTVMVFWLLCGSPTYGQSAPKPIAPQRLGIIFVVNGSGDDTSISDNLGKIINDRSLPLAIHTTRWCQWLQLARDHCDYATQLASAERLAGNIMSYRTAFPKEKIYLIGHSAGCHVVLATARSLPPDSVDRIILLAPSVSRYHDLRVALRCSRAGIDSLWSTEDRIAALAPDLLGNADRIPGRSAGESGFALLPPTHLDAKLYMNLRQYTWHPDWAYWGHRGGHYGFTGIGFLDGAILPLMLQTEMGKQ